MERAPALVSFASVCEAEARVKRAKGSAMLSRSVARAGRTA
jgi:hypothetical protein